MEAAARDVGAGAVALVADVTRSAEADGAVRTVAERWGRLDVVVNNAGITGRSVPDLGARPTRTGSASWRSTCTSVFYWSARAGDPDDAAGRDRGRIVNIASIAGKEGNPTLVPYSASKAAVIALTKALAKEVAGKGGSHDQRDRSGRDPDRAAPADVPVHGGP